jgi:hypothetical protein
MTPPEVPMARQHDIKSPSRFSRAEEYTRPFILLSFQPIISRSSDFYLESDADAIIILIVI